jgi:hypothetical protein
VSRSSDPIFAVITEHRNALEAVEAAFDREGREEDEDEITNAAQERQRAAELALWTKVPTTLEGAALLAHVREESPGSGGEAIWSLIVGCGSRSARLAHGGGDGVRSPRSLVPAPLRRGFFLPSHFRW